MLRRVAGPRGCGRVALNAACGAALLAGLGTERIVALQLPAPTYRVGEVAEGAALVGRAVFDGAVPQPARLFITKDVEVCGFGFRERALVGVDENRGLRDIVIVIEGVPEGKPWPESADRPMLDQKDCYFLPSVQIVRRGVELEISNSDAVLHNVHAYEMLGERRRSLFNFGQPPETLPIIHSFRPRLGHEIRLECDAHDFMLGWIYAVDSPYAVVVDERGDFTIDDIPPGSYTVTAWHPVLGKRTRQVALLAGEVAEIEFHFEGS